MSEQVKRTFTTRTPDKPGAFMQACKAIGGHGGNITRVSYKRGALNLFIEVMGTKEQLRAIEQDLGQMAYVSLDAVEPTVLVMEVKIPDTPGSLLPVLEAISRYEVNISYLNSRADENADHQFFNIGMEVKDPASAKRILDEVSGLYMLNVSSYNGSDADLDCTVKYIRLANKIQRLFSLGDDRAVEFISECRDVASLMKSRGQSPDGVLDSILKLAEFIAYHRDLNFKPRITKQALTPETDLVVVEPPCGSNTYILRNGDDLLFVDTGMGIFSDEMITELWEMFPAFFSMGKTILVTHADADRCGLLSVIENARIIVSAKAEARLYDMAVPVGDEDPYNYCYARLSRIITDYVPPERSLVEVIGGAPEEHDGFKPLGRVPFGDLELEVLEGPGLRTRGEMVVLCRQPRLLFTGDIYCNTDDVIPERAEFNSIAPFVPKDPEKDLAALEDTRSKLGEVMDSVGRDGMIVCGGHGSIRRLRS